MFWLTSSVFARRGFEDVLSLSLCAFPAGGAQWPAAASALRNRLLLGSRASLKLEKGGVCSQTVR
jgi:hypothetical protein